MNLKNKKNEGFTLIELLIVIGIIAILAAGVIIAINPGQQFKQARNSSRWSHMNSIANAIYSYAVDSQGTYPSCVPASSTDLAVDAIDCSTDLAPDYMSAIPVDPSYTAGNAYASTASTAACAGSCTSYFVWRVDPYRIRITSRAQEAIDNDVQVTQ